MTSQRAFSPHDPRQGSVHLLFTHDLVDEHSVLTTHSGLHDGGVPMYPERHEHTACPSMLLQLLFGPQGVGLHGFKLAGVVGGSSRQPINGSPM